MKKIKQTFVARWPEILILLFCAVLLSIGISQKKGYHMDELLSFELANAEFNPWIVPTQPQGRLAKYVNNELRGENFSETVSNLGDTIRDVIEHRGNSKLLTYTADVYSEPVWIQKETFTEYVTVNSKDDFNYLSVYFNVKDDNHPPLHFMALHTVSSLFREKMTPWMGCGINLVLVLGIMIVLMRLGRQCMAIIGQSKAGRIVGDSAALLYGLSAGAMSTTLLIRMYAMLTFFCVLLLEIHLEKLYGNELRGASFDKKNKGLIAVTVLGFLTQYFFLFYCLVLALVTAICLWRAGRKKELLRYVISMVIAAVIGIGVFPFAISDVFSSGRGVEALNNLASGLSGYGERIFRFFEILIRSCGGFSLLCLLLVWLSIGLCKGNARAERKQVRKKGFWLVLVVPVLVYYFLAARMSPYLVDRYMMAIFPFVILISCVGAGHCVSLWQGNGGEIRYQIALPVITVLACIQVLLPGHFDNEYLYPEYAIQEKVSEEYAELPCICVYEGVGYYENLPEFMQYDRTLLLTLEELSKREDTDSLEALEKAVVLIKSEEELNDVEAILKNYGLQLEKIVYSSERGRGDIVIIFQKVQNS